MHQGADICKRSLAKAGLQNQPGLSIFEIERADGTVLPEPSSDTIIYAGDTIKFAGLVCTTTTTTTTTDLARWHALSSQCLLLHHQPDAIIDTLRFAGLRSTEANLVKRVKARKNKRIIMEVVVYSGSGLVGKTPVESQMLERFNAVVVGIGRNGEYINGKLRDTTIRAGDCLLLETNTGFEKRFKHDRNFTLTSKYGEGTVVQSLVCHQALSLSVSLARSRSLSLCE
jgi:K+/H+ antiporter YhaU regulatory subunit KhtT